MFKKLVLFLFLISLVSLKVNASHLMGGEITWECQGSGQYIFTLKLYRDCNGVAASSSGLFLSVFNHPTVSNISLNLVSQSDISPSCNAAGPNISCTNAQSQPGWPASPTPISGAVEEFVFKSDPITLTGIPPAAGWIFTYDVCCRNGAITNLLGANSYGFTLRAVMYSYNGKNADPCFDSSPKFLESPSSVICMGYPFTYNHNAYDPELDSLSYSWAQPLDDITTTYNPPIDPVPVPFSGGYSYNSPLPGVTQNPANVPATINPKTGEISFTSFTQGNFVTVIKVGAWKCGQLVAEIYREIQIVLLPCAVNNPPAVTYTSYQDTVLAGELVSFTLNAHDPEFLPNGITPQTITISASGNQFGNGFTSTSAGCLNPPCATLTPATPTSSATNASTTFNWQTSCNHIAYNSGCNSQSNTYTFVFRTKDDFCPAPAENISTVSITVLTLSTILSPQPRCASVSANGDVTISWSSPVDTGHTFNSYFIYTSNSPAGPFTLLDSVFTYNQTSYTHVGANANAAPVYYYIQTRSGCFYYSNPIDTIKSIHLNVTNPGNGTALLSWNTIATPNISSSTGTYNIYQEYPPGVWTLKGSTSNTNYIDTIYVCNDTLNYRVEISDTSGCTSVSSISGGIFQNIIVPAIPLIDTLSVDDNNNALMNWNTSPSIDLKAYIVYKYNGVAWVPIDTIFGINNNSYTYVSSDAGTSSEQYRLAALDTCGNISPLGTIFSTIHLTASADICNRSAILNWNDYPTIGTGLSGYNIYQSTVSASGPYDLLATVAVGTLTYTASGLAPNTTYYYKIQAFDLSGNKTVSSNRKVFYSATPIPPTFSYLRKVSVVDPNQVDIICHVDVAASTLKYKIMRSLDDVPSNYTNIATVPAIASSPIAYSDNTVLCDKHSYYYKVINVDSCGYDGIETNIGRTILLSATGNTDMTNTLIWNDYEDWLGNVTSYNIYRGIDGAMNPTPLANLPYTGLGSNKYIDDISSELLGQGVFSYYIEAIEGIGNTYGFAENSLSNIAEAYQDPSVYIPNSFKPSGFNSLFFPVTTYVDFIEYEFDVYDRWGIHVFSSKIVGEGWDGSYGGKRCEGGVYIYLVRYKTSKGEYLERKGSVSLIR